MLCYNKNGDNMKALVFSGGGAKGSYQIGVWKALRKMHMKFDIVTGVSIGSINGALYVSNKYYLAKRMWKKIKTSDFFDFEIGGKLSPSDYLSLTKEIIKKGGMSFDKAEIYLKKYIKENDVRKSKINYGLITVSLTTKKERSLTKEQIPEGKLIDYISASSTCFPAVSKKEIDGESFIDGGFYDGLPINLAIEMGATEVLAVDLSALSLTKKPNNPNVKIDIIKFRDKTPLTLTFDKNIAIKNMKLGYNDAMKYFYKLDGKIYTFRKNDLDKNYSKISQNFIDTIKNILLGEDKRRIIVELFNVGKYNKLFKNIKENKSISIEINQAIEYLGEIFDLPEEKIYNINKFNKILSKRAEEMNYIKINKNLKGKYLISYIYNRYKRLKNKQEMYKELFNIALIFPKDFLATMYLIAIDDKNLINLKKDSFYEEIFKSLKDK